MTDLPSSLGIEAVELVAEGGRSVTVRVTGRWRRRRPELRGQPMLVVEAEGGRQRFLAMPEPPSLTGAAPGTWRMSFAVPTELAPQLPGRTFLQMGGVMVPLPVGDVSTAGATPDPDLLEARRLRSSELAAESARRRAAELAGEVARLEHELGEAQVQSDRLRATIAERERQLRAADQHVHAERALRAELEQQLTRRARAAEHDLRLLHARVGELERELARMRRAVDEAQHLAAAAQARAQPSVAERTVAGGRAQTVVRELDLLRTARATPPAHPPAHSPTPIAELAGDRAALGQEAAMADARTGGAALAAARAEIETQRQRSARAYEAIALVRGELRQLRAATVAPPSQPPSSAPEPVQAERLSAALARLREQAHPAPAEPTPEPDASPPVRVTKPWLGNVFHTLARQDPSAAGRLVLGLLPAQRAADPHAVAYDLVLSDLVCAQVTVGSGSIHVEMAQDARPSAEVDFQLVGNLAAVARLLAAGPVRRRLPSKRRARIRGDRRRLAALDRLVRARLGVSDLLAAGVKLDPQLALTVAAAAIEPGWTAGERFTLAHQTSSAPTPGAYLHVRDGKPPLAMAEAPHGPIETILICAGDELLGVLAGAARAVELIGEERPLALVRQWLERAQSG